MSHAHDLRAPSAAALAARYRFVRQATLDLTAPLAAEDHVVQAIPEASPTKWHLAHTTWFFERFCLLRQEKVAAGQPLLHSHEVAAGQPLLHSHEVAAGQPLLHAHDGVGSGDYEPFHPLYDRLFNSYYYTVGEMHPRPERGLLSRPTVAEIVAYREHVDEAMERLIERRGGDPELAFLIALGLNHEQQHQELLLTDVKQAFFANPLGPAYAPLPEPPEREAAPLRFVGHPGGVFEIGSDGRDFCFDNETPRHEVLLRPHALASRLVTNGEFREFIEAGGYRDPALWLADGWAQIRKAGWNRPLCWSDDLEREFTLGGWRPLDRNAPVCHVSYYEADAFARWAGARLPTEAEWEAAAAKTEIDGNFLDADYLHPVAGGGASSEGAAIAQLFGDVWEWCASSYAPYPGFRPLAGSLGEYNGKFMCNQMVVRGGSCATWAEHVRATYRSFFYPHDRWQFLGFRLARDE